MSAQFLHKHLLPKTFVLMMLLNLNLFSQCNWSNLLFDSYEYSQSIVDPNFVPGVAYGTAHPNIYTAHTGSQSIYINFIDSNSVSPAGIHAGTLFYSKTITVCPNTPYKVSSWFSTTFAGLQCNLRIRVKDGNGVILHAANNFPCAYAPSFSQYSSGTVTPTTSTMVFELTTNVGGGGGNDLSIDDLLIEQCLSSAGSVSTQTTLCSTSPTLNLFGLFSGSQPTYGTWGGPSALSGGSLGTYTPGVNSSGTYIYSYYYQNVPYCPIIRDTARVTVLATPTISVNQPTLCAGNQATLTASGAANYTWTPITGLSAVNGSTVSAAPGATTVYTITGSFGICTSTQTTTVTVNTPPVVTVNSETVCSGQAAVLNAAGAGSYSWAPSTGLSSSTGATVQASPGATVVYTVTGTSSGCAASATATLLVHPAASAAISASTFTLTNADPISTLTASGGNTFNWLGQNNFTDMLQVSPQQTSTYCVEVSENGFCPDTACVTIFSDFRSELSFPNVFTPNGDGDNDKFYFPYSNLRSFKVTIFNRWGLKVFETSNPDKGSGWDGKINGSNAADGVYSYVLRAEGLDDKLYEKAGFITLLR